MAVFLGLLKALGPEFLVLLVICVSYSNQLTGQTLSLQQLTSKSNTAQRTFNFHDVDSGASFGSLERIKRDLAQESQSKIEKSVTQLNDSHNSLVVFWAGKDVIICLAKDIDPNSSSTLYISRDYGGKFEDASDLLTNSSGIVPTISRFFNHPLNNGRFVFTDVKNQIIFTTDNYGTTFRATKVLFVPEEILFDPHTGETILAYEQNTTEKRLWVSQDFGLSWTMVQEFVKSASWDETTNPAKLYIQREEPDERSVIITSDSLFLDHKDTTVIFHDVDEFEIKDNYMFATKRAKNDTVSLWISYKRGQFFVARFPTKLPIRNFHIAEVSEGQIFVCVTHDHSLSNLYVGNEPPHSLESVRFSLSLERIVFFKPNLTWTDSWINDVTDDSFVDLHQLDGLRGVFIASVVKEANNSTNNAKLKINFEEVVSMITFDSGGRWEMIKPPEFDNDGDPMYCTKIKGQNCSLQVGQRLSELYPLTRAVPILSKKSATGVVLATGTVDNSMKRHLGVFISTDGAVTWKQVLKGNYLFNFGDHGGIIVAVKFYKVGETTDTMLYSTDEGESWKSFKFFNEKVRVLGLMTEPGENTTVFFVFGSVLDQKTHSWILIKVDLKNVFDGNCTEADYKKWSPWDSKSGRDCLLGKKDVYERRIPSHNCYNGQSYERSVKVTKCVCDRIDFECDFGFTESSSNGSKCIKDVSDFSLGVKPEWCKPGDLYYNVTRGYRKIPGDVCEGGDVTQYLPDTRPCAVSEEAEFMLVAKRDSVIRINLNDFTHVETLPLLDVRGVIAVDFDMKRNYIYWADVNRDNIMRLHLDGNSTAETLISTDLSSVEGLTFDWMSSNLYFCDGANAKIEVIRTDVSIMGRMRRKILGSPQLEKPRGLAIHPEKGYLFWTDWSADTPCIGRSWLDGSNVKKIVKNSPGQVNLKWPNGITVDYQGDKIYWVDAFLDQMAYSNLDGDDIKVVIQGDLRMKHPFAVGVHKNSVYWDDWTTHGIYSIRKDADDSRKEIFLVTANHTRLMDLKVYGAGKQVGSNNCSDNNNCPYLCLSVPQNKSYDCECPDGLKKSGNECVCPDGRPVERHGLCNTSNCKGNETFKCRSSEFCIPLLWKCDGDDDCGDNSDEDEELCGNTDRCTPAQFQCVQDRRCIPDGWRCDHDRDCSDGSDEKNCENIYPKCDPLSSFLCDNKKCILRKWMCDGDNDCMDNSDEKNCTTTSQTSTGCGPSEFRCLSNNFCISDQWRCDGDKDCHDGSDETNCQDTICPDYKFHCKSSNECIMQSWRCDGEHDCVDESDELNCTSAITPMTTDNPFQTGNCSSMKQMFQCLVTLKCIPTTWRCDGISDCGEGDGSDEMGCDLDTTPNSVVTMEPQKLRCPVDHWRCDSNDCIPESSVCDGYPDCLDSSDEKNCHDPSNGPTGCLPTQVRCGLSSICVEKSKLCDGKNDCPNKADESACIYGNVTSENPCNRGQHLCDDQVCIALSKMCNGKMECSDGSDEKNCNKFERVYQVDGISANPEGVDSHEILIEWWVDASVTQGPRKVNVAYMPSICEVESGHCTNETTLTKETKHVFRNLKPYSKYSVTVYVWVGKNVYPPSVYQTVNTIEDEPSEPHHLEVKQYNVDELCASWKKPATPNGKIVDYKLYFSPPVQPASIVSINESICISNKQSDPPFRQGANYSFWVVAENAVYESRPSAVVHYVFKGDAGKITEVKATELTANSVYLTWNTIGYEQHNFHYNITCSREGTSYAFQTHFTTENTNIKLKKLAPGTSYKCDIYPVHNEGIRGTPASSVFTTSGEALPVVTELHVTTFDRVPNGFKVLWTPPKNVKDSWNYGVFVGRTIEDIVEKNQPISAKSFPVVLSNLEACERYFVDVAFIENDAVGPLTEQPVAIETKMDVTAPPKKLRIKNPKDDLENVKVTLAWEAPCPILTTMIGYNITMRDVNLNYVFGLQNISFSNSSELEMDIEIQYGGSYEVTVSTSEIGARPSAPVRILGPEIPFPQHVTHCSSCVSPTISWESPNLPKLVTMKGNISYVVWLSKDDKFQHSTTKYVSSETIYAFDNVLDEGIYYIAVSVKDADGFESPRSSPIVLQLFDSNGSTDRSAVRLNENSLVGIVITVILLVITLVAALAIFIVRHKRLQASFLNFASSHYSTQSGSATFQQNLDEQDSPVIRGFSDDEPLLVA